MALQNKERERILRERKRINASLPNAKSKLVKITQDKLKANSEFDLLLSTLRQRIRDMENRLKDIDETLKRNPKPTPELSLGIVAKVKKEINKW